MCVTGAELRRLRSEARLSQRELAERLHVDPCIVEQWEAGEQIISHEEEHALLVVLAQRQQELQSRRTVRVLERDRGDDRGR